MKEVFSIDYISPASLASVGLTPEMVNRYYRKIFRVAKLLNLSEAFWGQIVNDYFNYSLEKQGKADKACPE